MTDDEKRERVAEARKAQRAVYLATDEHVAEDLSRIIRGLADALEETLGGETPSPGKRLDPEFRAELVDFAAGTIQDVWNDVPAGVDAITLAQNIVGAQEFAWIARGFPVVPDV